MKATVKETIEYMFLATVNSFHWHQCWHKIFT